MVADKGKKMKADENGVEESSGQIDSGLLLSIEKLQEIQDELEKINEEASEKVLEVEQKYNVVRKPVYDKRSEIIKSIPDFWLTAFLSHPILGELLTEEDHKIFKHISSIEVEDFKDLKSGYSISFNFNPNPYFEDTKLTKTFTFLDEEGIKITATQIKWKKDMALGSGGNSTDKIEAISKVESRDGIRYAIKLLVLNVKGLPNGVNHEKKGNKRQFAEESFFTWFADAQQKHDLDEIHDEVAEVIKEDLWSNPLTYFNNDADEEDDFDGEDDDDEDEDEEGKDEEDEDDQDDDDN